MIDLAHLTQALETHSRALLPSLPVALEHLLFHLSIGVKVAVVKTKLALNGIVVVALEGVNEILRFVRLVIKWALTMTTLDL